MNNNGTDWCLRFIKGMFIGTGAILPGVSGGALAAVFGLYEKIIAFLADITKDFVKNVIFFLPVGLGGVFGIFLLSFVLSFFLENAEAQILWFFIGCIAGIIPELDKQASKYGRGLVHCFIAIATSVAMLLFLFNMEEIVNASLPVNFFTWIFAGVIFGLGLIVPGLSPSNFLVYLDLYKPMTVGIKNIDFAVIMPILMGAVIIVFSLSKIMNYIFNRWYTGMFHFIFGVVIASTIMIIPRHYCYLSIGGIICAAACFFGVLLGLWMGRVGGNSEY